MESVDSRCIRERWAGGYSMHRHSCWRMLKVAMASGSKRFRVLESGLRWPSGDFVELALMPVNEEAIREVLGVPLVSGEEAGLGEWKAIGFEVESGPTIEVICYLRSSSPYFIVRSDMSFPPREALDAVI